MRLRKKGIEIEHFLELLGDNYKSRNSFLTGLPQPRTSGDLETLSKWFFGKCLKHTFSGGVFGPFKYLENGRGIISNSSAKRMMKEEMAKGKGIGHFLIKLNHTEMESDRNFNREVEKRINERIGLDTKKYRLDISIDISKDAFFGSVFAAKQGGGFNGDTAYNSTYYFETIEKGEILDDWLFKSNRYDNLLKHKKINKSISQRWNKWTPVDEYRLKSAKDELFSTSKEFMKEFNRFKNLTLLLKQKH